MPVSTAVTRRTLLAALTAAPLLRSASGPYPIHLGGPIFLKSDDPVELAREHRRLGYSAAYCPEAKASDTAHVTAIRDAFAAQNVVIAEVGAWKNLLDPDPAKRASNRQYVIDRLALAEAVGARCCVDIAGSFNPDVWFGPNPRNLSADFFDATVENCRQIVDAVKPTRTKFTIEMMPWSLPDGPESYLKLIKAVDRKAFALHLDVCNIINSPARYYDNSKVIAECFRLLGPWIASCHGKDLQWAIEYNVHFVEVGPGRGGIDYRTYLTEIAKLGHQPPLMLEHLDKPSEYDDARAYIQRLAKSLGLQLA
ncbi:MAG TPA: TIM barrel protein [Bryobacteraceae bacterium]|jgi:sugar phosphate isomerase/epimerase|nr:TIM barrel protein [Bryobacteraceae bacterium]